MGRPPSARTTRPSAARPPGAAGLTPAVRGSRVFVEPLLAQAVLPAHLADALDDTRWDNEIRAEGDEALSPTGRDVGTPIIQFNPPAGTAFFGPVISRPPEPEDAVRLWGYVTGLAGFPGFAELKRSVRERPQLPSFGVSVSSGWRLQHRGPSIDAPWVGASELRASRNTPGGEAEARRHRSWLVASRTQMTDWSPSCGFLVPALGDP